MYNFQRFFLLFLGGVLASSALAVMGGRVPFPGTPGPDFTPGIETLHQNALAAQQPELVLLGDSIAEENLDMDMIAEQTGLSSYRMTFGGSASALWYLAVKNNIVTASHRPRYLVIVFRDSEMTAPGYRVQGKLFTALDELASPEDRVVIERSYLRTMNPLETFAETYFPLYGFRNFFRSAVDEHVYALPYIFLQCGKRCTDRAVLNVFNFKNNAAPDKVKGSLDPEENLLYSMEGLDFETQVDDSYLPDILRLCRENHIQLILVRAKSARFATPAEEPRGLKEYLKKFESYVEADGALYLDISAGPRVSLEDFIDAYHVQPQARARYTQMFIDALLSVLP
ncbi:MAG: hypothetical protein HFACDABA_02798 [Anaerolineales bacterium]|nr:hypothetical protein [Anaerolineales bacterium]